MDWQPIETAPKGGREYIILANKDTGQVWSFCKWRPGMFSRSCWRDFYGEEVISPTHWMLKPNPPE